MYCDDREKNLFFLHTLIATFISTTAILCRGMFESFASYLFMLVISFAALILSSMGLVTAKKLQARFVGCVFCLVLSFLEILFLLWLPFYLASPSRHPEHSIVTHSLSPEESASVESINEEINRALNGKTFTETSKRMIIPRP
jgi:hypothetical protein